MKKLILLLLTVMTVGGATAQTVFRPLSFDEALAAAKAEGKPVFIDFYTTWCGPCKMMASKVFPEKVVGDYFNAAFICIQLDAEKEGAPQAKQYKIDAYPTMIVVDAQGTEIYRKVGANLNPEGFVAEVRIGTDPNLAPDKVQAKYEAGDRTPQLVEAYADQLMQKFREDRRNPDSLARAKARQIVADYYASLSDAQKLEQQNFFVFNYNYCDNPAAPAAQWLIANKDKFAADAQSQVTETLTNLCLYRTGALLQGMDQYTATDMDILAAAMKAAACNTKGEHDPALRILRARLNGDEAYLTQLQKDFQKMVIEEQSSVIVSFDSSIKSQNPDTLKRANKLIRTFLPDMEAVNIYYAAMAIMRLEQRLNPEAGH